MTNCRDDIGMGRAKASSPSHATRVNGGLNGGCAAFPRTPNECQGFALPKVGKKSRDVMSQTHFLLSFFPIYFVHVITGGLSPR